MERTGIGQIRTDVIIEAVQHLDAFGFVHIAKEPVQDSCQCNRIVNRPVMAFEQYLILVSQCVKTMILKSRMHQTCQLQRIQVGIVERIHPGILESPE